MPEARVKEPLTPRATSPSEPDPALTRSRPTNDSEYHALRQQAKNAPGVGPADTMAREDMPTEVKAMFNGVQSNRYVARPSRDTVQPTAEELAEMAEFQPLDTVLPALAPEDLSKSRDDKPGGLMSGRTPREAAVEEAQAESPDAPLGIETKVMGEEETVEETQRVGKEEEVKLQDQDREARVSGKSTPKTSSKK